MSFFFHKNFCCFDPSLQQPHIEAVLMVVMVEGGLGGGAGRGVTTCLYGGGGGQGGGLQPVFMENLHEISQKFH